MSAQADSQRVLTITRSCFACVGTGGQNQKEPVPSCACEWLLLSGMPSCCTPVSSTAVTRKFGVIVGKETKDAAPGWIGVPGKREQQHIGRLASSTHGLERRQE